MVQKRISAEERKKSILNVSIPLFAQKGRNGTTTKDIAQSAGISEALLYKHFKSKEDIYKQLQSSCLDSNKLLEAILSETEPGSEYIIVGVTLFVYEIVIGLDKTADNHSIKRLLIGSLLEDGTFASSFLELTVRPWFDSMSKSLKIAETKNEIIKDEDVNNKIWFTQHFSLIMNIFINAKVVNYTGSQDYLVDQILVFCLRGIGFKEKAINKYYNKEKINKILAKYNLSI